MLKKIGLVVVEYLYAPIIYSIAKKKSTHLYKIDAISASKLKY